jgi:hypothetical protein
VAVGRAQRFHQRLILGIQRLLDLNLFSLMWWGFIPVGALITGILAASGYYVGAVKLGVKPSRTVAITMLAMTALVQASLYYAQYATAQTDDGQAVSSVVSFPRFLGWTLSHARYGIGVHGRMLGDGFEVGFLGYVIGALQFLGLITGAFVVYAILADKPYCDECAKFLKKVAENKIYFAGDMSVVEELRTTEALSRSYFDRLADLPPGQSAALELELTACPGCRKEAVSEKPMFVRNNKLSYDNRPGCGRTTFTSPGISVAPLFVELPTNTHVPPGHR